ncbi:MAG: hypothetical protein WCX48_07420 [Bacteroidales bacterium]
MPIKIFKKIIIAILFIGAMLPVGAYIALQYPSLQTLIAKRATKILSKKLNTEVSIGKVYYLFFNKLIINDVYIMDNQKDTLLNCKKLSVSFSARDLLSQKFHFNKIRLYDGVFNLRTEKDRTSNLKYIIQFLKGKEPRDTTAPSIDLIAKEIKLNNFRFTYKNMASVHPGKGVNFVNFTDLDLSKIDVDIKRVRYNNDTLLADVNNISFAEKSGFKVKSLNVKLKLNANETSLNDLYIYDGHTELKAKRFNMYYNNIHDFHDFVDKIVMEIDLDNSYLNFETLGKIVPSLANNRLSFYATGLISGTVNNLKSTGLKITSESGLTYLNLDAKISGLPKTNETMAFVDINDCSTTTQDIVGIISSINSSRPLKAISEFSPLVKYNFKGRLAGLFTDFVANGNLTSNIGNIYMDMLLRQNKKENGLDLLGKIRTENFNVGMLLKNKSIGELSLNSTMSALLRDESKGGSNFYIDSLSIKKLELNNYTFSNIFSVGSYVNKVFNGKIICHDPNLDFIFQGIFGLSSKSDSYYDFYADVAYAELAALKLDKRDSVSIVSFKTLANFTQSKKGDIVGKINVKSLDYKNSTGNYSIGDIEIQSASNRDNFDITLKSSFADATYTGTDFFTNFIGKILNTTVYKHAPALIKRSDNIQYEDKPKSYKFNINFFDTRAITELLFPGFFISNKSSLKIEIDEKNLFDLEFKANRIGFRQNYSDNLFFKVKSSDSSLFSTINSDHIQIAGIDLDSSKINIDVGDNKIALITSYTNKGEMKNFMHFSSDILISRQKDKTSPHFVVVINPSELVLNNQKWSFAKSDIQIQDSTYQINKFKLLSKDQELFIDGTISSDSNDSLNLNIKNLDISPLNLFIKKYPFNLRGYFSGTATVTDVYKDPRILLNLKGKRVFASDKEVGDLDLISEWNNYSKCFNISVKNNLYGGVPFDITGTYRPKGSFMDFKGKFDNMNAGYFEPFLRNIISKSGGSMTGDLQLRGPLDKLALTSNNAVLNDLTFMVNFTKVQYTLNGPVLVNENELQINNAIIKDRFGSTGRVNGGFHHKFFRNLNFNTVVNFSNLECINIKESDNESFYGTAFGTGTMNISGPLKKMFMDISATSNKKTEIHIPLSSASEATSSDLLSFVEPPAPAGRNYNEDGYAKSKSTQKVKKSTDLNIKLKINVTPEAEMLIEIDKSVGDIITGYGSGLVTLDVNPSKDIFNIHGDYLIDRGYYKFVLQGLFNRDFTIQQGGNIGFNGDISKTNLNLTASYRTKASINTLISDTSSVGSRRNVDCLIKMSGALMNPTLSFGIDIPDIDPLTKSKVDAALNTDDKVVRQVMSILVSGSFIPDIQSSIVNNSTILYSNATEILSNQINNIFTQLDIPLDLSFNYQPGQNGRDIFDAAVSAQLFNNRVVVNGNIGNSKYINKSEDVVGDLDVEIKLDEKGRFRAKAFSHSADQYSNYLDNSQRNGVGLVYQEEFSSFRELFNSIFMSQKKRAQKAAEREKQLKGQMEMKPAEDKMKVKE